MRSAYPRQLLSDFLFEKTENGRRRKERVQFSLLRHILSCHHEGGQPMSKQRRKKKPVDRYLSGQQKQKRMQCNVKDRLFRYLFENDREALLNLYNALNGTAYQDSSQLEIVTMESAVYVVMKTT